MEAECPCKNNPALGAEPPKQKWTDWLILGGMGILSAWLLLTKKHLPEHKRK
jgi:hypothetical protein